MLERLRITFSTGHQCLLYDRSDGLTPVKRVARVMGVEVNAKGFSKQLWDDFGISQVHFHSTTIDPLKTKDELLPRYYLNNVYGAEIFRALVYRQAYQRQVEARAANSPVEPLKELAERMLESLVLDAEATEGEGATTPETLQLYLATARDLELKVPDWQPEPFPVPLPTLSPPAPREVILAMAHVRRHHPDVDRVVYDLDGRWEYTAGGQGLSKPWDALIDVDLLQDGADVLPGYPAVFMVTEE